MLTRKKLQGRLKLVYLNALIVVHVVKINNDSLLNEDEKIDLGIEFAKKSIEEYNSNIENHTAHSLELQSYFAQANQCVNIDDGIDLLIIEEQKINNKEVQRETETV